MIRVDCDREPHGGISDKVFALHAARFTSHVSRNIQPVLEGNGRAVKSMRKDANGREMRRMETKRKCVKIVDEF